MKENQFKSIYIFICISVISIQYSYSNKNLKRAKETLDTIYKLYSFENEYLLMENYPFQNGYKATYLSNSDQSDIQKKYSYLWPYSGSLTAVYAAKLYKATRENKYLHQAIELYEWTLNNLQDKDDYLIYDNIRKGNKVEKRKYAYNSGQMIQAAALLYTITKDEKYLVDANNIASSSYKFFFRNSAKDKNGEFALLNSGDIWFTAVMFRGFIELYNVDDSRYYIDTFLRNLEFAWYNMRDKSGLFNTDWKGIKKDDKKWLLTQFAMVEMYARAAKLK